MSYAQGYQQGKETAPDPFGILIKSISDSRARRKTEDMKRQDEERALTNVLIQLGAQHRYANALLKKKAELEKPYQEREQELKERGIQAEETKLAAQVSPGGKGGLFGLFNQAPKMADITKTRSELFPSSSYSSSATVPVQEPKATLQPQQSNNTDLQASLVKIKDANLPKREKAIKMLETAGEKVSEVNIQYIIKKYLS